MTVPYIFATQSGNISLSELDVNFANVKSAADTAATVTAGAQPNITSVGILTGLSVNGAVSAGGNVTGAYILGDGSQLTNLPLSSYGNANVSAYLSSGTVTSNITTTGNVTGTYILGNGSQLTGLPATYANTNVAAYLSSGTVTSNITTTGNLIGGTLIVTTSSDFNNNVISNVATPIAGSDVATKTYVDNTVSAGGFDITDGVTTENVNSDDTILFSGDTNISVAVDAVSGTESSVTVSLNDTISVVGNISGAYILGNGSQLTGLPATYANANVASYLSSGTVSTDIKTTAAISATGNVTGTYILGDGSQLTNLPVQPGTYANANVASYLSSGTVTSNIETTGNVTGTYILGDGSQLTNLPTSSYSNTNVAAYLSSGTVSTNILTTGAVSASGNVSGAFIIGDGGFLSNVTATGNVVSTQIQNGASLVRIDGANGNAVIDINSVGNIAVFATTGLNLKGDISATGNITGTNLLSVSADIAEKYVADAPYEPGTVLEFGGAHEVTAASIESARIAGVVSTKPAYLMNSELGGENIVALALLGRVPVKVRGTVRKGDMLVSAGNGYAQAKQRPETGTIIGKALEDSTGDNVIEVVVGRL